MRFNHLAWKLRKVRKYVARAVDWLSCYLLRTAAEVHDARPQHRTLQLQEIFDHNIPPYAIVSHRWEDGEVSLQDFIAIRQLDDPRYEPYAGFLLLSMKTPKDSPECKKIVKCSKFAASGTHEWVWIDIYCTQECHPY